MTAILDILLAFPHFLLWQLDKQSEAWDVLFASIYMVIVNNYSTFFHHNSSGLQNMKTPVQAGQWNNTCTQK